MSDVLELLAAMAVADVSALSDGQVRGEILDLVRAANLVQAALAARVVCFDRRELAQTDGFRSVGQWLAAFGRLSPHAANAVVKRGRLLAGLPALGAAAARGVVSPEHLAKVADVVAAVGLAVVAQVDQVLADLASVGSPSDVEVACQRVQGHADPDGPEPDPDTVLQRRSLGFARVGDMVRVRGQLDPDAGAAVMTALDALMTPPSVDDARTATQRRADALTDMARLALTTDVLPVSGGHRPQIGLLVTPQTLLSNPAWGTATGLARQVPARPVGFSPDPDATPTSDGPPQHHPGHDEDPLTAAGISPALEPGQLTWAGPISVAAAQRLACDSILYRIIYDPATGQPLDVGRTHRTAPSWIRKALHARDRGCRWPGCQAATPWTDAHHLTMWAQGGVTTADDMLLLCRWHHTRVHEGQWKIALNPYTGQLSVTRPDGRAYEIAPSSNWLKRPAA